MANALATKIKKARTDAGLTREQLAVALGVSMSTVVRIETGRTDVSYTRLVNLARLLDKPVAYFMADEVAA